MIKITIFAVVIVISFFHNFFAGPNGIKELLQENGARKFVRIERLPGIVNLIPALSAALVGIVIERG